MSWMNIDYFVERGQKWQFQKAKSKIWASVWVAQNNLLWKISTQIKHFCFFVL